LGIIEQKTHHGRIFILSVILDIFGISCYLLVRFWQFYQLEKIMYVAKLFSVLAFFFFLAFNSVAFAHPARVVVWAHGSVRPNEESLLTLRSDLAIACLETEHPVTYLYLGPGFDLSKHVRLDTFAGYDTSREHIASPRLVTNWGKFSTWSLAEYYSKNKGGYLFQMLDYAPRTWLQVGGEYEWFGSYKSIEKTSHGFGPHLLFNFGHYGLDVVLQARQYTEQKWEPVPFFRVHFFL
jgi:hypothetical protein